VAKNDVTTKNQMVIIQIVHIQAIVEEMERTDEVVAMIVQITKSINIYLLS
jgi:hypothetical protein